MSSNRVRKTDRLSVTQDVLQLDAAEGDILVWDAKLQSFVNKPISALILGYYNSAAGIGSAMNRSILKLNAGDYLTWEEIKIVIDRYVKANLDEHNKIISDLINDFKDDITTIINDFETRLELLFQEQTDIFMNLVEESTNKILNIINDFENSWDQFYTKTEINQIVNRLDNSIADLQLQIDNLDLSDYVDITSDQTIGGIKQFTGENTRVVSLTASQSIVGNQVIALYDGTVVDNQLPVAISGTSSSTGGLGAVIPSSNDFTVTVDGFMTAASTSDDRLKTRLSNIEVLSKLNNISGFRFMYNHTNFDSGKVEIGISADELAKIFPELVGSTLLNGINYKTINYSKLSVLALQAVKELYEIVLTMQDNMKN